MADVGLQSHDLGAELLVEEDLAGVGNVGADDGAVAADGPVGVDLGVDVDGALDVEAGEDSLHLHDAVAIGGPHAAEPSGVVGVQVQVGADGHVQLLEELLEGSVRVASGERAVRAGLEQILLVYFLDVLKIY